MQLTREEAIHKFRKMWNWIADETKKRKCIVSKKEYLKANSIGEHVIHDCYLCEYTFANFGINDIACEYCPIDWLTKRPTYACIGGYDVVDNYNYGKGLYEEWRDCTIVGDWRKAVEISKKIANLPEQ